MPKFLVELPISEWKHLRDLYIKRKNEPCSYGLLQTYINWIHKEPKMKAKIFTYSDWRSDGLFILIDADMETPHVFFNTLSSDSLPLGFALNSLDFNSKYQLSTFSKRHLSVVKQYLFKKDLNLSHVKYYGGSWYHLNRNEALKLSIRPPANIILSKLEQLHAEQINNVWPHKDAGSIEYIRKLIRLNESVGAFDLNKNLVAWCLRTPLGALGNVQVLDTHKRLGLGSLLVSFMSKKMALKNEEIMAPVKYDNIASRSMFEKLGFKAIDETFCMEIPSGFDKTDFFIS